MAKYDVERLLVDLKQVAVDGLNAKLVAITNEKADGLTLLSVPETKYFFQVLDKNAVGVNPAFAFYGIEDPLAQPLGPHTAEDYSVFFLIVLRESIEGEPFETKLLRYSRALKEIFESAFTQNKIRTKILITTITPTNFAISGVSGSFRGVGVKIRAVIA